ncbi:MAG TPA: hypothetical protein VM285_04130 [Polyangia bacterium]|nr:hypothetical protein [Polyangia bacterium]
MTGKTSLIGLLTVCGAVLALGLAPAGCADDDDDGTGTDADTDADSDADTDADSDSDSDACQGCAGPVCVATVSGRVLFEDDTPYAELALQFCVGNCYTTTTNADGYFAWDLPAGCTAFDFAEDEGIHMTLFDVADEAGDWARYSMSYEPTQEEISADFDLDVGTHYYFAVPENSAAYTEADGATVTDLSGVSFDVPAGDLGAEDLEIRVLEFPLETWVPPFVPADPALDALYFLGPYFVESTDGIELHIDPQAAGWSGTDTGGVYMLGDFAMGGYLSCDGENDVTIGHFEQCVGATFQGGEIVTEPIPRLGWVGLVKN